MDADHPNKIGSYRILELIGEGAFGFVYLADQTHPVRRKVALKVLKPGMDSRQILGRFEAEREAMALMSHPHIAQVLDAGVTDQGHSYFVMEYVLGEPITDYCDHYKLTVGERVELIRQVSEAIQHAHQKGIIHRDLKSTNIMVAHREGRAVPKVIDFGIAKAMHQPLTEDDVHTVKGTLVGTPGYMSPEQVLGRSDIDTTTDIYALGVLLFELLVGVLPLEVQSLDMNALIYAKTTKEPPTLSARLTELGKRATTLAEDRGVDVGTLKRKLTSDLKWVVSRALEKDRTRRYQSASEFGAELDRYLKNQPVLAGPPGTAYRLRKFVSRNKWPVGMAALLAVLLSGFAISSARQARRIEREATTVRQVSDFLVGLFELSDPSESLGNTVTAREILDAGAERIETELADQPVVQAQLMHTMGGVYSGLGLYSEAAALLEQAIELREREFGEDHLELAASLHQLGQVYVSQGRFEEAEPLIQQALTIREAQLGPDHPTVAISLSRLADLYNDLARNVEAESLLQRALTIQEGALGPEDPEVAKTLTTMGQVLWSMGEYEEAGEYTERGLEIREAALGPDHPDVGASLNSLAVITHTLGRYAEAEPLYLRSLAIREKALGPEHPGLASQMNNLAALYERLERYEEAEPLYLRSLAILEAALGPDHTDIALGLSNLAGLYDQLGRQDEIEPLLRRGLAIQETALGPDHPGVADQLSNLTEYLIIAGRYDEAEPLGLRALTIREEALGPDHPGVGTVLYRLGNLYHRLERSTEAEPLLQRALTIQEAGLGPDHPDIANTLDVYEAVLRELGRNEEADSLQERAAGIRAASGGGG